MGQERDYSWAEDVVRIFEKRLNEYQRAKREYEEVRENLIGLLASIPKAPVD